MVLSEMIMFLKFDHHNLDQVRSQFQFIRKDEHLAQGPRNLAPTSVCIYFKKLIGRTRF